MRYYLIVLMMTMICFLSGCGQPLADFAAGFGTGAVTIMNQANDDLEVFNERLAALNEQSEEMEILIEKDPIVLVNTLNPELGASFTSFIANVKELTTEAEKFKDEKGKVDWERLLMAIGLGLFGGGSGVNIYKNRK